MIQAAQVASKFTLFTHHAKTFPDLVTALRNSMLRTGVFKNERTAEEQVVSVLNFDIHLVKDFRGRRFIERVTECIPVEEKNEYTNNYRNEKTLEGKFDKFFDNATIYFSKTTNRELYKYRNVLEFIDDKLVLSNPISEKNIKEMRINMNDEDQVAFDAFLERNWGIKPPKTIKYDEDGNEIKPNPIHEKTTQKAVSEVKPVDKPADKQPIDKPVEADLKEEENRIKRKISRSVLPGRTPESAEPAPKKNNDSENIIRNELLDGLFDNDDDSNN